MSTAFLFPGQGSQTPEMGELVGAHEPSLLDLARELVGADPFALAGEGTAYAQPAILAAGLAAWTRAGRPSADLYAGHSLGELTALAAAGRLEPEDALRLAALRGRLMQEAAGEAPGGMLALLGDGSEARAAAEAAGVVIANDNGATQIVVAGADEGLEAAAANAKARGVRTMRLPIRGAFHSPAMEPARAPYRAALAEVEIGPAAAPVFSSITAKPFATSPDAVRDQLSSALVSPVRWRETMLALRRLGAGRFVEAGPGKALGRLARRAFDDVDAQSLGEPEPARA